MRDGQKGLLVMHILGIRGIIRFVRLGQAAKGIRDEYLAVRDAVDGEDASHQDACSAAPDPGFNQVAWDSVPQDRGRAKGNIFHALQADHGVRLGRPDSAQFSFLGGVPDLKAQFGAHGAKHGGGQRQEHPAFEPAPPTPIKFNGNRRLIINYTAEGLLEQLQVKLFGG